MYIMPSNSILKYIFIILNAIIAQDYTLDDCIQIAMSQKKTILSSGIGVLSASKGLKASYSGLLPSIQASGVGGTNYFPEQDNININFE